MIQGEKVLLTNREKEILEWIMKGKTTWEVSTILNISERTVNFHVSNFKTKLNAVSRSQAVVNAIQYKCI
jgi:DNA-binding CsgD family transcriptional regulator